MGREEEGDYAETPRRRAKRDRAATTKYDPEMYDTTSRAPVYQEEEIAISGTKRKRGKKARDDDDDEDWVPDRIAPPPPRSLRHVGRNDDDAHVHHQQHQQYQHNVYAPPHTVRPASMSTSVFHDVPVVIQSFAETAERRRSSTTSSVNGSGNGSLKINTQERNDFHHSIHITPRNVFPVRIPLSSTSTQGQALRSLAETTMSVMDLFYPDFSSSRSIRKGRGITKQGESGTPTMANNGATRESKRRRRGDTSSTRSSRSRNVQEDGADQMGYDMLQFGVDSVKLIPQGLVDRIDPQMGGDFVSSIIVSHVENWSRRAGFGGIVNNFVHELTTLLTAYYPCTYPTLLDEVLSSFVFKRPELLAPLLRPMMDKLLKMGETAAPAKYPIIESLARKCNPEGLSTLDGGQGRHDLSCLTLLQCLVEQNMERFSLTPWIVACASSCTRKVRALFMEKIIRFSAEKMTMEPGEKWQIYSPLEQISEILTIERQNARLIATAECPLAVALIRTVLCHNDFQSLGSAVINEALQTVFGHASVRICAKLLHEWFNMIRVVGDGDDINVAWTQILNTVISNCSQLSGMEPSWFVIRVLHNIINQPYLPTATLKTILVQHAHLCFGYADLHDLEELETWQKSQPSFKVHVCGAERATTSDTYQDERTKIQLRTLIEVLRSGRCGQSFIEVWSVAWANSSTGDVVVLLPWCYVWAIVRFCVAEITPLTVTPIDKSFFKFAEQLCDQYFEWLLSVDQEPRKSTVSIRITQVFDLVMTTSHPFAQSLLVRMLHKCSSSSFATRAIFSNVVISHITSGHPRNTVVNHGSSNMTLRVTVLKTLAQLAQRNDTVGDYIQMLLTSRPLFHVVNNIISSGGDEEVTLVLDALTNAINRPNLGADEFDTPVVELLVVSMYRRSRQIARNVRVVLEAIIHKSHVLATTVLWCLLHVCATYCCGCSREEGIRSSNIKQTVAMCADLFQSIWMSLESASITTLSTEVFSYIQHRLASCMSKEGVKWNVFLVQVLLRLIQSGRGAKSLSLIRFVTSGFERKTGCLADETQRLEILQAFCTELRSMWPNESTDWSIGVSQICSAQVRTRLRTLATQSTCATTVALAKMILHSSMELRALKHTRTDRLNRRNNVVEIIEGY